MTFREPAGEAGRGEGSGLLDVLRRGLAAPGDGLAGRVVHGGLWQAAQRAATRGVLLLQLLVLARLLVPEDFGLFGIALLTQQTLRVLLRFGVDAALIQRAEGAEAYLDTAWTVKVLQAAVVAAGLLVLAPWVAAFFDAPGAEALIRVLAIVALLRGAENIGTIFFRKELAFRKEFALRSGEVLANAGVAIALAVVLGSVWALMAGLLAGAAVRLALSYVLHPYRPRPALDRERLADLWGFGKWLFGSSTLVYASTQGDDILLGRWLGAASLGVYQVAYRISNTAATEVSKVISRVAFPALSQLQSDDERLRRGFLDTFALTALLVVPLAVAIAWFIPDFVRHVIGDQWSAAVGPVRILAAAGLLRAFSACWGPLYRVQARTEKPFRKQAIRTVLTLGPAYPATVAWGVEGMSACVLAGIAGAFAYDLTRGGARGALQVDAASVGRAVAWPAVAAGGAVAAAAGLSGPLGPGLMPFVALAVVYCVVYAGLVLLLEAAGRETGLARLRALLERAG